MGNVPDYGPATYVCNLDSVADEEQLVNDPKGMIWQTQREYAVLFLGLEGYVLVYGGAKGIILQTQDVESAGPFGPVRTKIAVLNVGGQMRRVHRLVIHIHPHPTGPSDGDFRVLEMLDQNESVLVEISGGRTVFKRRPSSERVRCRRSSPTDSRFAATFPSRRTRRGW